MPESVIYCVQSVLKHHPEHKHVLITESNLSDYITIPEEIMQKYHKGIIPKPQFSDIIRCYLLAEYGGIWLDSTVLLEKPLPKDILESDFFVFKKEDKIGFSNWLMSSGKNHPLIEMIKDLLTHYWKKNDELIYYFIMHWLFSAAQQASKYLTEIYDRIPFYDRIPYHELQEAIKIDLPPDQLLRYKNSHFLHKLNHRDEEKMMKHKSILFDNSTLPFINF